MATLQDLADWLETAPVGTVLEWESPDATEEDRRLAAEALERFQRGRRRR